MDRLDIEAMRERVKRMFLAQSNRDIDSFRDYAEVLEILWEEEFMEATLRMLEVAGKIPHRSVQISFLQGIVETLVQPLSTFDAAGLLTMVLEETTTQKQHIIPVRIAIPPRKNEWRPRPGVR